jgi:hypothetical protein
MKRFKIKQKPSKPARRKINNEFQIYGGEDLQSILKKIPSNISLDEVVVEKRTEGGYGYGEGYSDYFYVVYETLQSDKDYDIELNHYAKKLEEYNKWAEKNEDNIKQYYKEKEEFAKQARAKELEDMARNIEKGKKELEKLKKKYEKEARQ